MKSLCIAALFLLPCGVEMIADEQAPVQSESPLTISDYDRQISFLKEQVAKYDSLATTFDRKAQRLQSRDFTQFRRAASMREECKSIAEDLKKHLSKLEQERDLLVKESAPKS